MAASCAEASVLARFELGAGSAASTEDPQDAELQALLDACERTYKRIDDHSLAPGELREAQRELIGQLTELEAWVEVNGTSHPQALAAVQHMCLGTRSLWVSGSSHFPNERRAREQRDRILELAGSVDSRLRAYSAVNLITGLLQDSQLQEAKQHLDRERELCQGPDSWLASLDMRRAQVRLGLGELKEAQQLLDSARGILDGLEQGAARVRREILYLETAATLEVQRGTPRAANRLFDQLLELKEDEHLTVSQALLRANILMALPDREGLRWHLEECLENPDLSPKDKAELQVLAGIARAYRSHTSRDVGEQAQAILEPALGNRRIDAGLRVRGFANLARVRLRLDDLEGARQALAEARSIQETYPPLQSIQRPEQLSLAIVETRIARGFGDRSYQLKAYANTEQVYRSMLERWKGAGDSDRQVGFLHQAERRVLISELMGLAVTIDPEGGAARALESLLEAQALGSVVRRMGYETQSLAQVREALDLQPHQVVLVLHSAPEESYVFALDHEGLSLHQVTGKNQLELTAGRFLETLAGAGEQSFLEPTPQGAALVEQLFPAELQAELANWEEITFIGFQALGLLPFEALPFGPDESARPLAHSHAVSQLPSLPFAVCIADHPAPSESKASGKPLLFVADRPARTAKGKAAQALPFGARHVALLRGEEGPDWELVRGKEATAKSLNTHLSQRPEQLHLVAHGLRRGKAGIHLADGPCSANEFSLEPCPDLVVLSICRAAGGLTPLGDDSNGSLAIAALEQGARQVLAPARDLEFQAAMRLIARWNLHRGRGASTTEALRLAKLDLAGDEVEDHPSYWWVQVLGR